MIPSRYINAQGLVPLWEATDDGHRQVMLASVDAAHALNVDPTRWSLDKPEIVPDAPETEDDSAKGSG